MRYNKGTRKARYECAHSNNIYMNILTKMWNNFKSQPDVWFFYGFLLTFTLSIRKVLFFYPINGKFNEWTGTYLYLSDVLLLATFFLWGIFILRNKNTKLSMNSIILWLKQAIIYLPRHQKHWTTVWRAIIQKYVISKFKNRSVSFWCGGVPLLLVFWAFISVLWSENQNIALFKAIKLLELFLLYVYIILKLSPFVKGGARGIFKIFIALGFIQAIIGIGQFILQHSIGLFWLKESLISLDIAGVAKIVLDGEKFIRAYGLFPHPNILGGFLLVSILLTIPLCKRGSKGDFYTFGSTKNPSPPLPFIKGEGDCFTWNKLFHNISFFRILLIIQIIALILTFSKSAILGLIIAFLYILWKNKEMFHIEHFGKKVIIIAIILVLSLYLAGLDFGGNLEKSYGDRIDQLAIWKSTAQNNLLLGNGIGSYLFHVKHLYPNLETWQYQPIHNVFLLILAELGFVGVFIFILFLWKLFRACLINCSMWNNFYGVKQKASRHPELDSGSNEIPDQVRNDIYAESGMTLIIFKSILLTFIFIMLFDHYLWDIQQGQVMLWLVLGIAAGLTKK